MENKLLHLRQARAHPLITRGNAHTFITPVVRCRAYNDGSDVAADVSGETFCSLSVARVSGLV